MDGWMDGWREGRTSQIKFLTIPLTFLFPFLLCLLYSTLCSYLPYALQVEWAKEFRSETCSLPPCLHFQVWGLVPLSGIMACSSPNPQQVTDPLAGILSLLNIKPEKNP